MKYKRLFGVVNPRSGNCEGGIVLSANIPSEMLGVPIVLADIFEGESGNKPIFQKIKQSTLDEDGSANPEVTTLVVSFGGDGTFSWTVDEVTAHGINFDRLTFAVVGFGSGNDFARSLNLPDITLKGFLNDEDATLRLVRILRRFLTMERCVTKKHDVWKFELDTERDDSRLLAVERVDGSTKQKANMGVKEFSKTMNNYFSLGYDSHVGLGFEKKRSTSRLRNKLIYMSEGIKKILFHPPRKIHEYVDELYVDNEDPEKRQRIVTPASNESARKHRKLLPYCLDACVILALNINSYGAGMNVWKPATRQGVKFPKLGRKSIDEAREFGIPLVLPWEDALRKHQQKDGDGILEFVSFSSRVSLCAEFIANGHGRRLAFGSGPFTIRFKPLPRGFRIYFEIDGEFFVCYQPKQMSLKHSQTIHVVGYTP